MCCQHIYKSFILNITCSVNFISPKASRDFSILPHSSSSLNECSIHFFQQIHFVVEFLVHRIDVKYHSPCSNLLERHFWILLHYHSLWTQCLLGKYFEFWWGRSMIICRVSCLELKNSTQVYHEKPSTITSAYQFFKNDMTFTESKRSMWISLRGAVIELMSLMLWLDLLIFPFWHASQTPSCWYFNV